MWKGKEGVFSSRASVRVYGTGLVPQEVTLKLGIDPSRATQDGESAMWVFSTKGIIDETAPLEVHIQHIVDKLGPMSEALVELQRMYTTDILCYFASQSDTGGFVLSTDLLSRLASLKLSLNTDQYFCCS